MQQLRELNLIFSRDGHGRFNGNDAVFMMHDDEARLCIAGLPILHRLVGLQGQFKPLFPLSHLGIEEPTVLSGDDIWRRARNFLSGSDFVVANIEESRSKWEVIVRGGFIDPSFPPVPDFTGHERMMLVDKVRLLTYADSP